MLPQRGGSGGGGGAAAAATADGHARLDRLESEGLEETWQSVLEDPDSLENLQGAIDRQF